jgi:hypothetical protein
VLKAKLFHLPSFKALAEMERGYLSRRAFSLDDCGDHFYHDTFFVPFVDSSKFIAADNGLTVCGLLIQGAEDLQTDKVAYCVLALLLFLTLTEMLPLQVMSSITGNQHHGRRRISTHLNSVRRETKNSRVFLYLSIKCNISIYKCYYDYGFTMALFQRPLHIRATCISPHAYCCISRRGSIWVSGRHCVVWEPIYFTYVLL